MPPRRSVPTTVRRPRRARLRTMLYGLRPQALLISTSTGAVLTIHTIRRDSVKNQCGSESSTALTDSPAADASRVQRRDVSREPTGIVTATQPLFSSYPQKEGRISDVI